MITEPSRRTSRLTWIGFGIAAVLIVIVLAVAGQATRFVGTLSDDTVIATLGSKSNPYPPELRAAARRAREAPDDRGAALAAARRYLDYGRLIGDARLVGAALGILTPWVEKSPDAEILNLAASGRQYVHDFAGATELLDRVLATDPQNAQALLSRANIRVVQGRFSVAEEDCQGLARARRPDLAILCDTTVKALSADSRMAYERLDRLVTTRAIDPALTGYADSLLAEIARFNEDNAVAKPKFEAALAASPEDLRTLMILVDFDLAEGRNKEALTRLEDAPVTDGIMVRQVAAYIWLGNTTEAERIGVTLRGRLAKAASVGETAHAREAARYWLLAGDARQALASAEINWENQRELEDALLLMDAAKAAGSPAAADPVLAWAEAEGVVAPMYLTALRKLKGQAN